ncbi:anthranilate synthase component I [Haloarcula litorea]|uniref:anthranilate synthase component I n=1 Tax=Haloarcula litorea TaxID=3032579 RepID=UPI0023E8B337|nr:anthranilate synthase component I [Halomicroarcula sp. GDY20]
MTLDVDREAFVAAAGDADRPVVVRAAATLDADVDPLDAYAALSGRTADVTAGDYTFLLESAEKVASSDPDGAFAPETDDRHARFSFVGYEPRAVVTVTGDDSEVEVFDDRYADLVSTNGGDVLDDLRAAMPDVERRHFPEMDRQHLEGGLVGFLSYDAVYDLWLDEVGLERPDSRFPDAQFVLSTATLRFDHLEDRVELVFTPVLREGEDADARYDELLAEVDRVERALREAETPATGGFRREAEVAGPQDEYEDAVERAKEYVLSGDIYQGVVSRTRELYGDVDPLGFYEALREVNPSPYMYLLGYDDLHIVGASPETLVSVAGDHVVSNPIAGTCQRGNSPVEDRRLAGEMLADGKERAEHTMLVDLARNDVRRVAEAGSVRVQEFMNVLKYSHVQHIESTVTGTLAADRDAFDAARATFPAGTLSGAPKIRAMEIIDELERSPRGPYGGGVGYVDWGGDADFAIVIRSATVEADAALPDADGTADRITVQAGAGIVADSDPESEYVETEQKMDGVLAALERIEADDAGPDGAEAPAGVDR